MEARGDRARRRLSYFCREHSERQAAIDAAITKAYREYKVIGPPISFQMQNMAITHHG